MMRVIARSSNYCKPPGLQAGWLCYVVTMTTRTRNAALATLLILAIAASILWAIGRPPICTCGYVSLWGRIGPTQSQMLADWYSPSHFIHGLIFYLLAWLAAKGQPVERRFLIAMLIEAAWEIAENSPVVIDRYREATMALGYSGDSILNSMSDISMMAIGFVAARKLPVWASIALAIGFELLTLAIIRDNLTLNVWMLLAPNDALRAWQGGA
jgi:uncharacterized membrane protein YiaA